MSTAYYEEIIKDGILMFRITPDDEFVPYTKEELTDKIVRLRKILNLKETYKSSRSK